MGDRSGHQLDNYQLVRLLGAGSFGEVYLAKHVYRKLQVAVKILPQLADNDFQGFLNEARTVRFKHPHIVQVLDFGVDKENRIPFIVMEYIPHGTLRERYPKGTRLPINTLVPYVKQVADALQYAHDEKLIHRDVKPENILLRSDYEVLLSDFGIATIARSSRSQSVLEMAGTLAYMAPEQIQGKPVVASDQYALGVIVYECLSGERPFNGGPIEIATQHMVISPPPLRSKVPTLSSDIEQVVLTALEKEPSKRFASVEAFANALEQASKPPTRTAPVVPNLFSSAPIVPPLPSSPKEQPINVTPSSPQQFSNLPPNTLLPTSEKPLLAPSLLPAFLETPPLSKPAVVSELSPVGGKRSTNFAGLTSPGNKIRRSLVIYSLCALVIVLMVGTIGSGVYYNLQSNAGINVFHNLPQAKVYVYPLSGVSDIKTFDPGLSTDMPSIQAINMVFTGLVQLNDKLEVVPQLAQSYNLSSDGLTWTFKLKTNLKFSDGASLTSTDVAYSIDRALQPAEKSTVGPIYLSLIKDSDKLVAGKIKTIIGDSLMAPDPNTVVIVTNKKASYFLDALTYSCSYVVEKSLIDKYGTNFTDHLTEGGGAGPFKVSEYTHGKQIVFVPNPNYYGPKPQLTKLVYPFYKQADMVYKAYQAGQVDYSTIPLADLAAAKQLPNNQYQQVPQLWINYYAMNYLVKPFDNIHIRQAFDLAIDKDLIAHSVWKDTVLPSNHIVPKGMPGYNPNLTGPAGVASTKGDPTKARVLFQQGLQEEGWTSASQVPPIKLTYPSGVQEQDNEVAALVQMWQTTLGVSVKANPEDFNKLLSDITAATNNAKGLQFWGIAWIADYPDPQDWTTLQFDKGVPNNNMNYGQNSTSDASTQQQVQQQLEAADVNPDQTSRLDTYMNAEQQLVNDVAWMPMEQVTVSQVLKPYVKGLDFNPLGLTPPNDWGSVYIQAH